MNPRSFIVFGDDWGGHPSSVQHLFRRIAQTHRTLWVNTVGLRPPRLDLRDAQRVVRKLRGWVSPPTGHGPDARDDAQGLDLHVVSPPMVPWMRPAGLRALNRASVRTLVGRAAHRLGLRRPVVVTTVPNGVDGRGIADAAGLAYYCVDDFTQWPGVDAAAARSLEAELLEVCDLVLATSDALVASRIPRSGRVSLLSHGVDVDHLGRACDPETPALPGVRRGRPVLGYLGLVDARMDVDLVVGLATARPDWDIVFVGPTDTAPDPRLHRANVRFVPAVAYGRLPEALAAFDVALLPYARNGLTQAINPLKLREYLASGLPVVATSLPEVRRFAPEVAVVDTVVDTVAAIEKALAGPRDRRAARAELLRGETWDARAETFLRRVDEALGPAT